MTRNRNLEILLGDPRKAILSMVLPFFVAASVVQINQFADTFWISGLGNVAGSALSTAVPVYGLLTCAGLGIGVAATSTIAFQLGKGDMQRASKLAGQALLLGILFAIAGSIATTALINPAIDLLGAQEIRKQCLDYILPFIILSPFILSMMILGGILRGEGAALKSTVMQMSSALLNIILDPILIYSAGMGITGAGLATCLSSMIALGIGLWWFVSGKTSLKLRREHLRPDRSCMKEVFGIGGPRTGQSLISDLADLIQRVFIIAAGGTNSVMYYNYTWRYIGLVQLPTGAIDTAMMPVCSAAYGNGDPDKIRIGFRFALRWALIFSTVSGLVLFIFTEPLVGILTYEESMKALSGNFVWTLRVSSFLLPFAALIGIGNSMLQSLKRADISMYFMLGWAFLKLALYAVACTISFEAIIYCMVAVHWLAGICVMYLACRTYSKLFPGRHLLSRT